MSTDTEFHLLSRNFVLACLANFCYFGSFYILIPPMPQYVASLGGTAWQVGLVIGFFTLTSVIFRPFFGKKADTRGRKPLMLLGSGLFFLLPFVYIFVQAVLPLFLLRIAHGFAHGSYVVSSVAYIADLAPSHRRGEVIGIFGVSNILGMAVFPAWGTAVLAGGGSFQYLFSLAALIAAVSFVAIVLLADIRPPARPGRKPLGFFKVGGRREVLIPSIALLSAATCYGAVITFLPLFAPERGLPDFGIFFTGYAASTILSRVVAGRTSDRVGRRKVIVPAMALLALAVCLLPFLHSLRFLFLISFLFGLSFGSLMPTLNALVVDHTPPDERGSAMAFFMSGMDVGITVGAMGLGFVGGSYGYPAVYWICGVVVLACLFVFCLFPPRRKEAAQSDRA
jgi:MFS family permease